jgi:hypothetical protein
MSNKIEIDAIDIIFIMDTLKVLGQALDSSTEGFDEVNELLIESEGILNKSMEVVHEDIDLLRPTRYQVA